MKEIKLKDQYVLRSMMSKTYDHNLIDIICTVAEKFGLTMTEAWRFKRHKNDVHGTDPGRANDLRTWEWKPETLCYEIENFINQTWEYDLERPHKNCAKIHDSGKGIHMHVQTHPNTRKR